MDKSSTSRVFGRLDVLAVKRPDRIFQIILFSMLHYYLNYAICIYYSIEETGASDERARTRGEHGGFSKAKKREIKRKNFVWE